MADANQTRRLNLVFAARGDNDVDKTISKMQASLASLQKEVKKTNDASKDSVAITEEQINAWNAFNSSLEGWEQIIKKNTSGIAKLGGAINGLIGSFGPWGAAIAGIIALWDKLKEAWDWFSSDDAKDAYDLHIEGAKDYASQLDILIQKNGDLSQASLKRMMTENEANKAIREEFNASIEKIDELNNRQKVLQEQIEKNNSVLAKSIVEGNEWTHQAIVARSEIENLTKEFKNNETALAALNAQYEQYIEDQKRAKEQAEELEQQEFVRNRQIEAQREAEEKYFKEIEEKKEKAKKAQAQYEADLNSFSQYQKALIDKTFAATNKSALDALDRQVAYEIAKATDTIKNEELRQDAIKAIQQKAALDRIELTKKEQEEKEAILAKTVKRERLINEDEDVEAFSKEVDRIEQETQKKLDELKNRRVELIKVLGEEEAKASQEWQILEENETNVMQNKVFQYEKAQQKLTDAQKKRAEESKKILGKDKKEWEEWYKKVELADKIVGNSMTSLSKIMEMSGVSSQKVQIVEMTASMIQAGSDALKDTARAIEAFASGDFARGAGFTSAAIAQGTAAASYAKGIADLGGSSKESVNTSEAIAEATQAQSFSSSYSDLLSSGNSNQNNTSGDITINLDFSSMGSFGAAIVEAINAETINPSPLKINRRMVM